MAQDIIAKIIIKWRTKIAVEKDTMHAVDTSSWSKEIEHSKCSNATYGNV